MRSRFKEDVGRTVFVDGSRYRNSSCGRSDTSNRSRGGVPLQAFRIDRSFWELEVPWIREAESLGIRFRRN